MQAIAHGSIDTLPEQDPISFEASEGVAVFHDETRSYWVAPRRTVKSGVTHDEWPSEDKKKFDASRFKEIDNLLKLNALSVMTIKDCEHFAKTTPENTKPTNVLDKWKYQDNGTLKAESRCVLVGWKDPVIYQLERAAPTPTFWTGAKDVTKKQPCHNTATRRNSSVNWTRSVVAC